jgi:hypothetical protein
MIDMYIIVWMDLYAGKKLRNYTKKSVSMDVLTEE